VTLIEEDALLAAGSALGLVVPPGASRRQVVVRGVALNPTVGQTLRVGEVVLAVTGRCDPCGNMEDTIGPGARAALANRGGVCARVLQGGRLRVGDTVAVEQEGLAARPASG
jgi:MOSC domain-containing protein YiiM